MEEEERKAIKQSLYKETVSEAGYSSGIENTFPYEGVILFIHGLLTVLATVPACPQALMSAVKL